MAWSDKPTDNQLFAVEDMVTFIIPKETRKKMIDWLKATATKKQVSDELGRLYNLRWVKHDLYRENVFDSPIWDGFER